jgi:hypothetical protein
MQRLDRHTAHVGFWLLAVATLNVMPAQAGYDPDEGGSTRIGWHTPGQAKAIISTRARAVTQALKSRRLGDFARFVHPTRGVRFSPYIHASGSDRVFSRSQVRNFYRDAHIYNWGEYDGSGEPIRLRWRDYYTKFVYRRDFANASQVFYNTFTHRGNTINNLKSFYGSNSIFVEFYIPVPAPNEMQWGSLWQVWKKRGGTWYLVGIANDQWTI